MQEYEYSFEVLSIIPYVRYCEKMGYHKTSQVNERQRIVFEKDNVKFEIDQYFKPEMCMIALEGQKSAVDAVYLEIKQIKEATPKAGCYLINKDARKVALIYREKQNDYSFPKGHLEEGESLKQCAIRETAEETKRDCQIIDDIEPIVEYYITPRGEKCICYMFAAYDIGPSNNNSLDTHDVIWLDISKVEEYLTYDNLKQTWKQIKNIIENEWL